MVEQYNIHAEMASCSLVTLDDYKELSYMFTSVVL